MAFSICYLGELYPWENEVIPEVRKRHGGRPGFEVFVWRRLTSCCILSAMSPEIQEWSHKSRSRINNLYLLSRPIVKQDARQGATLATFSEGDRVVQYVVWPLFDEGHRERRQYVIWHLFCYAMTKPLYDQERLYPGLTVLDLFLTKSAVGCCIGRLVLATRDHIVYVSAVIATDCYICWL